MRGKFASYYAEYQPKVGDKLHYAPCRNSGGLVPLSPVIYATVRQHQSLTQGPGR